MFKKLIFSLVVSVTVLALAETGCRIIEAQKSASPEQWDGASGWQATFFSTLFTWHEPDPVLLWRFRAGLSGKLISTNDAHCIGAPVETPKPANVLRILLLGDSSPVGLGLDSYRDSFGYRLQFLLQQGLLGRKRVELVNAAVSGYSSEQCRKYLETEGWTWQPDIVVLYCGNNDASLSGPASDQQLIESQRLVSVRKALSHLALYRAIRAAVSALAGSTVDATDRHLVARVSPERFAENLRAMALDCNQHDCPLFVLKPPVPLEWPAGLQFVTFAPVTNMSGQYLLPPELRRILGREIRYCIEPQALTEKYGRPDWFTKATYARVYDDHLEAREAVQYYRRLLATDADDPVIMNNLGVSLWRTGDLVSADTMLRVARSAFVNLSADRSDLLRLSAGSPFLFNIGINLADCAAAATDSAAGNSLRSTARLYLDSALQADFMSLRVKRSYLHEIDRIADTPGTYVIDLPRLFNENGNERLFVDHCHPTKEGHRIIADEVARIMDSLSIIDSLTLRREH
jgi:lysophospholipase L1-like esterase